MNRKGKHAGTTTSSDVPRSSDPLPLSLPTHCFLRKGDNTINRKIMKRKKMRGRKYKRKVLLS